MACKLTVVELTKYHDKEFTQEAQSFDRTDKTWIKLRIRNDFSFSVHVTTYPVEITDSEGEPATTLTVSDLFTYRSDSEAKKAPLGTRDVVEEGDEFIVGMLLQSAMTAVGDYNLKPVVVATPCNGISRDLDSQTIEVVG